jgi:hypothetical protein
MSLEDRVQVASVPLLLGFSFDDDLALIDVEVEESKPCASLALEARAARPSVQR